MYDVNVDGNIREQVVKRIKKMDERYKCLQALKSRIVNDKGGMSKEKLLKIQNLTNSCGKEDSEFIIALGDHLFKN